MRHVHQPRQPTRGNVSFLHMSLRLAFSRPYRFARHGPQIRRYLFPLFYPEFIDYDISSSAGNAAHKVLGWYVDSLPLPFLILIVMHLYSHDQPSERHQVCYVQVIDTCVHADSFLQPGTATGGSFRVCCSSYATDALLNAESPPTETHRTWTNSGKSSMLCFLLTLYRC